MDGVHIRNLLENRAKKLGFDGLRITSSESIPTAPVNLRSFLEKGYHGSMKWLHERSAERSNPRKLWSEVCSIVLVAMNYGQETDALAHLNRADCGGISIYARNRDYHSIIKGRLKELAHVLVSKGGGEVKVFVDTAPVMEKPLAAAAGLGWQGKHTNLVSRKLGSWFFLGAIYSTLELPLDAPEDDHCGNCRACLDSCPTGAFPAPYQLDARRCISYLTIENRGHIPMEFRKAIGNRIFGCDDCLAACPWNKFAKVASEAKLKARSDLNLPSLHEFLQLSEESFRKKFTGSPIKRIGRNSFLRNVLIAAGNSKDKKFLPLIENLLDDPSELIRGAAVWSFGQIADKKQIAENIKIRAVKEKDEIVLEEWNYLKRDCIA